MIKFDIYPTTCHICGGKVEYKKMVDVGIKPFQSGYCYICLKCRAYVGTHKNRPKEALGILAHNTTRQLRIICHEEFDKHWMTTAGKNRAYFALSKALGIKKEDCHFGYMDNKMLIKSMEIMEKWGDFK